jgi:hypothetical protein
VWQDFAVLGADDKATVFRHARARFPELLPAGAAAFDDLAFLDRETVRPWYRRDVPGARTFTSTGTAGRPKAVPWTPAEDAWYVGEKRDLFRAWLGDCRRVFISLAVGHNAGSAPLAFDHADHEVHDAGLSSLADQCAAVRAFDPEVLYCSPVILRRLVDALAAAGASPRSVRRIITNGEVLFPSARARAAAFFGVDLTAGLMDTYGSNEVGTIAHSCPACGAYHFLDGLYPEAVPAAVAHPVSPPTASGAVVLAVSSVKRTSFPVVRFVTYDVVQSLRRTLCGGVRRFTCDRILGRCDDLLSYGELFPPYELGELIERRLPGARWFAFNPGSDLTIVVEGSEPPGFRDELWDRYPLHGRMAGLGLLPAPDLRFVRDFDTFASRAGLPAARSGKDAGHVHRVAPDPRWFDGSAS